MPCTKTYDKWLNLSKHFPSCEQPNSLKLLLNTLLSSCQSYFKTHKNSALFVLEIWSELEHKQDRRESSKIMGWRFVLFIELFRNLCIILCLYCNHSLHQVWSQQRFLVVGVLGWESSRSTVVVRWTAGQQVAYSGSVHLISPGCPPPSIALLCRFVA